ncbi:SDH family Clp fold serine proteinase [Paenibacillus glucanolyticus]|uniref:SDH family Clp fold serine proteinase n=1 Tax=Paenibacillus glucanolyticus TaxID=59843 RepID=UPI0034CE471A
MKTETVEGFRFPLQSPLFYVNNRERYQRQEWIKQIEAVTGRRLIAYISNFSHPESGINRNDVLPFIEILSDLPEGGDVDLLIHTPGGDPNATEQMVNSLLPKVANLRVIVPLSAKSAGTMMALVADEIVMSDSSELGPIDPQVVIRNATGGASSRPAKAFLKGLQNIQDEVNRNNGQLNPAYFPILQSVDAAQIQFCHQAEAHAEKIAKKWLLRSMCSGDSQKAQKIAEELLDIEKYPNHGNVISWKDATDIGLNVCYLPPSDDLWKAFWTLIALYDNDMKINKTIKIFEGSKLSVTI